MTPSYYSQCAVFASPPSAFFIRVVDITNFECTAGCSRVEIVVVASMCTNHCVHARRLDLQSFCTLHRVLPASDNHTCACHDVTITARFLGFTCTMTVSLCVCVCVCCITVCAAFGVINDDDDRCQTDSGCVCYVLLSTCQLNTDVFCWSLFCVVSCTSASLCSSTACLTTVSNV